MFVMLAFPRVHGDMANPPNVDIGREELNLNCFEYEPVVPLLLPLWVLDSLNNVALLLSVMTVETPASE